MTNHQMGKAYIEDAALRLNILPALLSEGGFNVVVREAQETVELFLKGALRYVGVEPVKLHDVADILRHNRDRFPSWFQDELEKMADISTKLADDRGPSYYGDEARGLPASALFDKESALEALEEARLVGGLCRRLIEGA